MCLGELMQRLRRQRMQLFPALAPAESRLSPQTDDPGSSLGQAKRHGLTPPPQDGFSPQGVALTIFQRHLSLKSAPCGAGHFGGGEAEIDHLRCTERWPTLQYGVVHAHDRISPIESEFTLLENHLSMPTLT